MNPLLLHKETNSSIFFAVTETSNIYIFYYSNSILKNSNKVIDYNGLPCLKIFSIFFGVLPFLVFKINPLFNEEISYEEAEFGLNDVLNKKIARQYIDQELNEARENIFKNEEETLTWRIDQANKLLNKAISGISDNKHDEQNKLNDDLNSINDLIKDKIWIKKNY